jgi:hypothetical protein
VARAVAALAVEPRRAWMAVDYVAGVHMGCTLIEMTALHVAGATGSHPQPAERLDCQVRDRFPQTSRVGLWVGAHHVWQLLADRDSTVTAKERLDADAEGSDHVAPATLARKAHHDLDPAASVSLLGFRPHRPPPVAIDISERAYLPGMISYFRTQARTLHRLLPLTRLLPTDPFVRSGSPDYGAGMRTRSSGLAIPGVRRAWRCGILNRS